ncbi:MAG TPA: energy transducer TonB [Gemmatimonadaceae bacterium]|nr:energy transducer TonB [Gemmatimonadaceae bacterium]
MRRTPLIIGVAVLMMQFASAPVASAQTHKFTGDIWTEADSGRIVYASGATVYLWPEIAAVKSAMNSACTAYTTDMTSWTAARETLNDTGSAIPASTAVTRDLALLHSIAQLPHAMVQADSLGHFVFDSIPSGTYWIEAETVRNGRIVQWWKETSLLTLPFRIGGENSASLGSTRLGPLEYHSSQFCTDPEARVGAAAFMNDTPLTPTDRIYQSSELDRNVTVIYSGDRTQYPESMRKAGIPGEVVLSFVVDARGNAEMDGVRVVRSSAPDFVEPAKRALATMRFAPGEANGKSVRSRVSETFSFSIQP